MSHLCELRINQLCQTSPVTNADLSTLFCQQTQLTLLNLRCVRFTCIWHRINFNHVHNSHSDTVQIPMLLPALVLSEVLSSCNFLLAQKSKKAQTELLSVCKIAQVCPQHLFLWIEVNLPPMNPWKCSDKYATLDECEV